MIPAQIFLVALRALLRNKLRSFLTTLGVVIGVGAVIAMTSIGATTVVCLNERHELAGRYDDYLEWLDRNSSDRAVWHAVPDLHAPSVDDLAGLADDILSRMAADERVLVHCGGGIGRAGTTAAAVLIRSGMALDDAVAVVAAHRPMAGPEAGAQREVLELLARRQAG